MYQKNAKSHRFIKCSACNLNVHVKCNEMDNKTFEKLKSKNENLLFCIKCKEDNIPFFLNTEYEKSDLNEFQLQASDNIKTFFKGINEFNSDQVDDEDDNIVPLNCKYYDLNSFKFKNDKKNISLLHLNIAS